MAEWLNGKLADTCRLCDRPTVVLAAGEAAVEFEELGPDMPLHTPERWICPNCGTRNLVKFPKE